MVHTRSNNCLMLKPKTKAVWWLLPRASEGLRVETMCFYCEKSIVVDWYYNGA
ncbi:MAG: hypothetical protein LBJ36_07360 [Synergistaceae bacterium]|nr:hypothetical protein [Synergistaceae bacterium]